MLFFLELKKESIAGIIPQEVRMVFTRVSSRVVLAEVLLPGIIVISYAFACSVILHFIPK